MTDTKKYIVDGKVKRDIIVADVKRGRITKEDVLELDRNPKIKDAYFGPTFFEKCSQADWDNDYLDELALMAVSEVFNKEYLLYLSDVATFVIKINEKKQQKSSIFKGLITVAVVVLLIICAIVFFTSKSK